MWIEKNIYFDFFLNSCHKRNANSHGEVNFSEKRFFWATLILKVTFLKLISARDPALSVPPLCSFCHQLFTSPSKRCFSEVNLTGWVCTWSLILIISMKYTDNFYRPRSEGDNALAVCVSLISGRNTGVCADEVDQLLCPLQVNKCIHGHRQSRIMNNPSFLCVFFFWLEKRVWKLWILYNTLILWG